MKIYKVVFALVISSIAFDTLHIFSRGGGGGGGRGFGGGGRSSGRSIGNRLSQRSGVNHPYNHGYNHGYNGGYGRGGYGYWGGSFGGWGWGAFGLGLYLPLTLAAAYGINNSSGDTTIINNTYQTSPDETDYSAYPKDTHPRDKGMNVPRVPNDAVYISPEMMKDPKVRHALSQMKRQQRLAALGEEDKED